MSKVHCFRSGSTFETLFRRVLQIPVARMLMRLDVQLRILSFFRRGGRGGVRFVLASVAMIFSCSSEDHRDE